MKSSALKCSHFNVIAIRASPHKQPEKVCSLQMKSSPVQHHKRCTVIILLYKWSVYKTIVPPLAQRNQLEGGFGLTTKSYELMSMEVLYNVLTEFGMGMKPLVLIHMCLNETQSEVWIGIHLSDIFPVQNNLK